LLKTFSKTAFQGQYLTKAVSNKNTPTTILAGLQKPVNEKPKRIRMIPRMIRTSLSIFAKFLLMAIMAFSVLEPRS